MLKNKVVFSFIAYLFYLSLTATIVPVEKPNKVLFSKKFYYDYRFMSPLGKLDCLDLYKIVNFFSEHYSWTFDDIEEIFFILQRLSLEKKLCFGSILLRLHLSVAEDLFLSTLSYTDIANYKNNIFWKECGHGCALSIKDYPCYLCNAYCCFCKDSIVSELEKSQMIVQLACRHIVHKCCLAVIEKIHCWYRCPTCFCYTQEYNEFKQ